MAQVRWAGDCQEFANRIVAGRSLSRASQHYLGEGGTAYDERVGGTHRFNADFALRVLGPHLEDDTAVLDFGCADGALLAALPNGVKCGVEVNPASRARAVERGLVVHESTREIDDDSVGLVISSHVLEHTLQPLDELGGLRRVLTGGGKLVLILPVDDWRVQRDWVLPDGNHHLYGWTPQLLANLLAEAGFAVESIDVVTYTLPGRFTGKLHGMLPSWLFDGIARATAVLRRRRQLVAVARA